MLHCFQTSQPVPSRSNRNYDQNRKNTDGSRLISDFGPKVAPQDKAKHIGVKGSAEPPQASSL